MKVSVIVCSGLISLPVHTIITAQDHWIPMMMALSSLNSKVTSQGAQLKRIENMLDKLISGSSVGEGQAEGWTKDGQVCVENNLCT